MKTNNGSTIMDWSDDISEQASTDTCSKDEQDGNECLLPTSTSSAYQLVMNFVRKGSGDIQLFSVPRLEF
jgi:hypothetical protein